jgi:hypothetical protein
MTTRPDPNTPEAPQEATEGRQSAPEGSSGQRETPKGQNEAQTGAQSLDGEQRPRGPVDWARQQAAEREEREATPLRDRIAQAIEDAPYRPEARRSLQLADSVMRVPEMRQLLAQAARLEPAIIEQERLATIVDRVREEAQWLRRNYPGLTQLHSRLGAALQPPAHNAGPSIAECAQADDAHWNTKYAGEGQ